MYLPKSFWLLPSVTCSSAAISVVPFEATYVEVEVICLERHLVVTDCLLVGDFGVVCEGQLQLPT